MQGLNIHTYIILCETPCIHFPTFLITYLLNTEGILIFYFNFCLSAFLVQYDPVVIST
jgi:hypothetical protein